MTQLDSAAMLSLLYDRGAHAPSGVDPVRFEFERERRMAALKAHLERAFPLALILIKALGWNGLVPSALDGIAAAVKTSDTIEKAAEATLISNVAAHDPRLELLLAFDGARRDAPWATRPPVAGEADLLLSAGIEHARLLDRPLRFGDFAQEFGRLVKQTVSASTLVGLQPSFGRQVYAYWRTDRMRAAEVTELMERVV